MLVADAISLGIVAAVARIYPFVIFAETGKMPRTRHTTILIVNQVILWSAISVAVGIAIALVVHAYKAVQEVRRMLKNRHTPAAVQISQLM